ncbi:alcohol dehydrogenase protein [Rutstroemia sp. NJR-2017a BVV2]|nr:alcohol dehydrogenase protein [Rutstroemia sp. NJR-2017a BVV2]
MDLSYLSTVTISSAAIPKTTKAWTVEAQDGFESLRLNNKVPIPTLADNEVFVKFHAVSLNYRDLIISKGIYPYPVKIGVIPGSDGAGEALAVGSKVTRFQPGFKVLTLFHQAYLSGSLEPRILSTGLGAINDGTFRQHGTFNEAGLVEMPATLDWQEASTLTCAALTAWNALYGLRPLVPGDVVLTQGTAGVSLFAVQFAKAAGATIIATTSSPAKAELLKKLGANHVINYKNTPEWGAKAASLTPNNLGVHHVLEVGGANTMAQSLKAVKIDGVISVIGWLGGQSNQQPTLMDTLSNVCVVRGLVVGNRLQFEAMNRAIDANGIKPVVDEKVFSLEQLKEACQHMWDQKHFGKVTLQIE